MACKDGMIPAEEMNFTLGFKTRRCPEEEVEDLCKDTPSEPVSIQFPGTETH